ncbi:MAG: GNAT family N-acetyltransferase [Candidatus Dormibacteraeota bacterium]|nr:GNAT family N-acetyltransferase [Candidatus Dormibacteraeota bacterium]
MAGEIEVRRVLPGEYAEAGEATARAYREFAPPEMPQWQAYLTRIADVAARASRTVVLVALVDGVIAGTTTIEVDRHIEDDWRDELEPDQVHVRMLGVDPAYRRRGVGRALMHATIALAQELGRSRVTLETTGQMLAAQQMYESLGFVALGRREVQQGLTFLSYELRLPEH